MLKFAPDLSNDYEYAFVWGGQSNSRPWGAKAEGFAEAPELNLELTGLDIVGLVINAGNHSGLGKRILVPGVGPKALTPKMWQGAQLRLYDNTGTHYTKPLGGYATIKQNDANELIVDWVGAALNADGSLLSATVSGYICRPDEKWKSYPNVRILVPFQPEGTAQDALTTNLPYPDGSFKTGGVNLTPPASVTSFADCAKFLPYSFLEGIDGYGVSNEGDAANGIEGARSIYHASSACLATTSAYSINMPVNALSGGYVVVNWKVTSSGALKRSWARISTNGWTLTNGSNAISLNGGWQGDGTPLLHSNVRVGPVGITHTSATSITATNSGAFGVSVVPGDVVECGNSIGIVSSATSSVITLTPAGWFGGTPTVTSAIVYENTATATVQLWEAWIPHYNNSPYAYDPGLGFRYPNNDMMPYFGGANGFTSVAAGLSTATNSTSQNPFLPILTNANANWLPNEWQGYKVTSGGGVGEITGNSKTKLYGSWINNDVPANNLSYVFSTNAIAGPRIHNRARGITAKSYGDRFGSMLNFASRMSAAIGKRINIIHLGVNSSPMFQQSASNFFAFPGQVGWFDYHSHLSWSPSQINGSAQRLKQLINTIAPAALTAEGNTKTLKILGIAWLQGEGDALGGNSNSAYGRSIKAFADWLRDVITDAGMNPYGNSAKIPWVQPRITHVPYEITGTFAYYNALAGFSTNIQLSGDDEGWANNGIVEFCETDGFAAYQTNDDLTKVGDTTLVNSIDPLHYDGKGEVHVGLRIAEDMGRLVDYSLSFGSTSLEHQNTRALSICNMALACIGESQITSLDDGSTQANLCKQFLNEARDTLLQSRQWGFALRRVELAEVKKPPMSYSGRTSLYDQYAYCYVVPADALNAFAVLPASANTNSDYTQLSSDPDTVMAQMLAGGPAPVPYAIENSPTTGGRLIFTNQADAVLRYTARIVDAETFSPLFATALSWMLASMLASSIIKGDTGEQVSQRCLVKAGGYTRMAANSDGNQRSMKLQHVPDHLSNR